MGVPMHTASWERKRENKNSTEEKLQLCKICNMFLWHPPVKPQGKSVFCIFVLVKNMSCQSKAQRVAAENKPKQMYSPNASISYIISLWTGKQCCLLHVTKVTNIFYYPCDAKHSSQLYLFKMSKEGKWSDDIWRMEIKHFKDVESKNASKAASGHHWTTIIPSDKHHFNRDETRRQRKCSLTLYFSPCVE